jgi:hypothetical protein
VGNVDWKENFQWALYEITSNGGIIDLASMKPTSGGTILEAEGISKEPSLIESEVSGFTGKGYVGNGDEHSRQQFQWNYTAPESGQYILEFRYTLNREDVFSTLLEINREKVGEIAFWSTGNKGAWVWESITVKLEKGENSIAISPEKYVMLDHINIIKN